MNKMLIQFITLLLVMFFTVPINGQTLNVSSDKPIPYYDVSTSNYADTVRGGSYEYYWTFTLQAATNIAGNYWTEAATFRVYDHLYTGQWWQIKQGGTNAYNIYYDYNPAYDYDHDGLMDAVPNNGDDTTNSLPVNLISLQTTHKVFRLVAPTPKDGITPSKNMAFLICAAIVLGVGAVIVYGLLKLCKKLHLGPPPDDTGPPGTNAPPVQTNAPPRRGT